MHQKLLFLGHKKKFFSGEGAQPPPQNPPPHPTTSAPRSPFSEILNTPLQRRYALTMTWLWRGHILVSELITRIREEVEEVGDSAANRTSGTDDRPMECA